MCNRFPREFDVQFSCKPSNCVLGLIFVLNIKFPRATYHTIVSSTEELYCLNSFFFINYLSQKRFTFVQVKEPLALGLRTLNLTEELQGLHMRVTFERRRRFRARQPRLFVFLD